MRSCAWYSIRSRTPGFLSRTTSQGQRQIRPIVFDVAAPFGRLCPEPPYERARPRLELNALGAVSACPARKKVAQRVVFDPLLVDQRDVVVLYHFRPFFDLSLHEIFKLRLRHRKRYSTLFRPGRLNFRPTEDFGDCSNVVIEPAKYGDGHGCCAVSLIVKSEGSRGTNYAVRALCTSASRPEKTQTVNIIVRTLGPDRAAMGRIYLRSAVSVFDDLKNYQRCP
jgi:hypothetical protein